MENKELISIIIPVYNGEKYIKQCLLSILKSKYTNIEIIVVDDGSTDNSYDICNEIAKTDSRIKLFSKQNEGIAKTRNFAISKVQGKYICFADQDDIVFDYTYEILKNNIDKFDSDLCIGSYALLINKEVKPHYVIKENYYLENEKLDNYIISMASECRRINYSNTENCDCSWTLWNCMYKKEIFDKYEIEIKRFVNYEDDFLLNFDYLFKCKRISFEKELVYCWRKNLKSESNSHKYVENLYENRKKLINYLVENLKNIDFFNEEKWINLSYEKNLVNEIRNVSNPLNKRTNKESIEYLQKIYINDIKKMNLKFYKKFNLINFIKNPELLTYYLCRKGKIKLAFYINKYLYYKFIFKIFSIIKRIIYN